MEAFSCWIDSTSTQIAEQEEVQKMNHEQILQDLSAIRDRAKAVWEKIGQSIHFPTSTQPFFIQAEFYSYKSHSTLMNKL